MKKKVGKVKRFIAMLMVGITLSSSVFYSYSIPAQATAILPTVEAVTEALMTIFGYSLGLGKSVSSVSDSMDSSLLNSIYSGSAIDVGSYGTVDFSNGASIYDFLTFTQDFMSSHILGSYYHNYFAQIDYLSYKNSGTSASKAMLDGMQALIEDIDVELSAQPDADEEHRAALIREFMVTSIVPLLSPGGDDDDDPHSTSKAWRAIAGLLAAFTAVSSIPVLEDGTEDESALATPEKSEYLAYTQDDLIYDVNSYYTGAEVDSEGYYVGYLYGYDANLWHRFRSEGPVGVIAREDGAYVVCSSNDHLYKAFCDQAGNISETEHYGALVYASPFVSTLPIFSSSDDLENYLNGLSDENAVNKLDTAQVSVFYETIPTSTVPEYVINFMTRTPSTTDLANLATALDGMSTDTAGTTEYIPAVENVVQTATDALPEASTGTEETPEGSIDSDITVEQDPETGEYNYSGALQLLLDMLRAIRDILQAIFNDPLAAIVIGVTKIADLLPDMFEMTQDYFDSIPDLLTTLLANPLDLIREGVYNIIELVPNCFELVRGWLSLLPEAIFNLFENPLIIIQDLLAALNPFSSWWPLLQPYLDRFLESVPEADVADPDIPSEDDGGNGRHSFDLLSLLNGLWLLIMILIMLLSIFLHLMIFIINIFKIPATTGYLNAHMVSGLNYIKTLEITGIGLSVYDFMMGLVYILMVFGVVKVLRANIHHIKIPKSMRGGLFS